MIIGCWAAMHEEGGNGGVGPRDCRPAPRLHGSAFELG